MKPLLCIVFLSGALQVSAYTLQPSSTLKFLSGPPVQAETDPPNARQSGDSVSLRPCPDSATASAAPGRNCSATTPGATGLPGSQTAQAMTSHQSLLIVSLLAGIAVGFLAIRR